MDEGAAWRYSADIFTTYAGKVKNMPDMPPKPALDVMLRAEELLREQLMELGEKPEELKPHELSLHMSCGVHPDGALSYTWKGLPILDVVPERQGDGSVRWKFFTRDSPLQ